MNLLYCRLYVDEYNRLYAFDSTKEIWDKLEVTNEGTKLKNKK